MVDAPTTNNLQTCRNGAKPRRQTPVLTGGYTTRRQTTCGNAGENTGDPLFGAAAYLSARVVMRSASWPARANLAVFLGPRLSVSPLPSLSGGRENYCGVYQ